MMSADQMNTLAEKIDEWLGSIDCLNIREDLGEKNFQLELLEDQRSAGGNGTWQYHLTADGLRRTYTPTDLARSVGATPKSEATSALVLAEASAKCGTCCWKAVMYNLMTLDQGSAEARPAEASTDFIPPANPDPLATTAEL